MSDIINNPEENEAAEINYAAASAMGPSLDIPNDDDGGPVLPPGDVDFPADEEMLGAAEPESADQGTERRPEDWVTGDDPATEAQKTYLDRLAREAGETIPADLTKAEASKHIDRLQEQTGIQPRKD